jgi:AGZA family xanthine/uracil permease-like MFS transporter
MEGEKMMGRLFGLRENNTNVRTEIMAGVTTFFTMAYIIFVNPSILAETGMSGPGVFVATIIATVVGTLIMGLVANVPYAVAPGMGLNAFFTYTVCGALGFRWQEALAMVFICGIVNIIITVTKVRKSIIKAIPRSLQLAIGGGIGLFIAYIGMKNAGFLTFSATTDIATPGNLAVPGLANLGETGALLSLLGLAVIVVLMMFRVKAAMIIGIGTVTLAGLLCGFVKWPDAPLDASQVGAVKDVAFSFFGDTGLSSMFKDPGKILVVLMTIFAFSLSDTFDTIGTFIGTGRKSGIFDAGDEKALEESNGFKSKMDKALFADSIATSIGALAGTSNTTTYIESASGIGVGGRTGLTSVVVAALFLLCLPFGSLFGMVPPQATAPVLIVVGALMAESFAGIKWGGGGEELEESLPAFLTVAVMTLAYSISYGIAFGFIFYCLIKIAKGKVKELHPILIGASILFILNFAILAAGI